MASGGTTIELPWPPKELTPNFKRRKHWRSYAKPTKDYRTLCAWLTRAKMIDATGVSRIQLYITFCPPDRRKRDDDGMIGAFKAGRDGVADGLGVDDSIFRCTYTIAGPEKPGKIIVRIGEVA